MGLVTMRLTCWETNCGRPADASFFFYEKDPDWHDAGPQLIAVCLACSMFWAAEHQPRSMESYYEMIGEISRDA